MADRGRGDVELRRRLGDAEVARRGLAGAEGVEGRESSTHDFSLDFI